MLPGRGEQRFQQDWLRAGKIRCGTLGKADSDRLAVAFTAMTAGIFTGTRTNTPENGGKDVVAQIDFVGLAEPAVINRFEVTGNIRSRRAGDLAGNVLFEPEQILWCRAFALGNRQCGGRFEIG